MGLHWITLAKITGPMVKRIRKEMVIWTSAGPPDGEEPQEIYGDIFLVKEEVAIKRMQQLAALLEDHAHQPPIVFFEKFIDPWTVAPLLHVYTDLRKRNANLRLAMSDVLDYLLIQPSCWDKVTKVLCILQERLSACPISLEYQFLIKQIIECASAWQELLSPHSIDQAIIITCQGIDISWSDEEVIKNSLALPSWYQQE